MEFWAPSWKLPNGNCFPNFALQALNTSSSIFYSNQPCSNFSLHNYTQTHSHSYTHTWSCTHTHTYTILPPHIFNLSFLKKVHVYCFTLHHGCIFINQERNGGSAGCMLHSWILVSVSAGRQAGRLHPGYSCPIQLREVFSSRKKSPETH